MSDLKKDWQLAILKFLRFLPSQKNYDRHEEVPRRSGGDQEAVTIPILESNVAAAALSGASVTKGTVRGSAPF